jgi:hypothetical protein
MITKTQPVSNSHAIQALCGNILDNCINKDGDSIGTTQMKLLTPATKPIRSMSWYSGGPNGQWAHIR